MVQHVFKGNNLASDRQWVYRQRDEGNVVAVGFNDFKKAFDSVGHEYLITTLQQNFGIRDSFLTCLKRFFLVTDPNLQSLMEPSRNFSPLTTVFHQVTF